MEKVKKITMCFSLRPEIAKVIKSVPPNFRSEFIEWVIEHRNKDLDKEFVERIRSRFSFDFI